MFPSTTPLVLVIDDDKTLLDVVRLTLGQDGFRVVTAKNGAEGLEVYDGAKPELVITDLVMPEKEGIETILALRRRDPQVRIIAMTGGSSAARAGFLQIAKGAGATYTLSKPFSSDELLAVVRNAIRPARMIATRSDQRGREESGAADPRPGSGATPSQPERGPMKILHLEDYPPDAELIREVLLAEFPDAKLVWVSTRARFIAELEDATKPDVIVSDFNVPGFPAFAALDVAGERCPGVPFVFHSGSIGEEKAIMAVRAGAYDYVLKDNLSRLPLVLRRAITESGERRNREANERRIRQLAGIIERATESIVATDLEGRVTVWNRGAAALYGIPAEDALGTAAEELLPVSIRDQVRAARSAVAETGSWRGELAFTTRDGRDIVIDARMSSVPDEAGKPNARLIVARDITETKKLEEQFLRVQRLESLGLLAAGIAHDLNNVLAPVLIAGPLLRQRTNNPEDSDLLNILETSAQRGAGLVRQILGFAQGSAGRFRSTQIKHLVSDVVQIARASFPKSIELDVKVASDLWPLECDPTQLHQVLLNLAVNARDAMLPQGGKLTLHAENRELDQETATRLGASRPGPHIMLQVADTGCGMSPEIVARIWEPFFTTKGADRGTGLGLATVRGIVARHDGFITMNTEVGRGTSFFIYLPASAASAAANSQAGTSSMPRGNGELVLLVEDVTAIRRAATVILERYAYRVIACPDGHDGVAAFSQHSAEINLILTDMDMPRLNGPAFATVVRRLRPDMKILAMSGIGKADRENAHDESLFDGELLKPFTPEALLAAVHQALCGDGGNDSKPGA